MRVLVLGAGGMAGHVVSVILKEYGYNVSTLSAHKKIADDTILMDITDQRKFQDFLKQNHFDVIVNCVGILIQVSEKRKDLSTYLNAYMPHQLESMYVNTNTKIIHLSTDCVFSGEHAPYYEDSVPDGNLFYDRTKYLGELNNEKDLTFRMSIIGPDISPEGVGLFSWFMKQSGEISGYSKAIWNGITTIELAHAIHVAIQKNLCGLYHLVPNANISKYNLLQLFKQVFDRNDITVLANERVALDKTLVNTRTDFDFVIKDYPAMIADMKKFMEKHRILYPHYYFNQ